MTDRLNFFEPWERLPAKHENQLTRAFLVVLRCCPIAQQAWLSLVDHELSLHSLPQATFDTQRGRILRGDGEPNTDEPIRGISVLCSADISDEDPGIILESDRGQVLDGIIRYGNELVVVLESKLDGPADDHQARNINLHGQPVVFGDPIRRVSWREVLANFGDLAQERRSLVSGAELTILNDFLVFVDTNFPRLGPFNTLERCGSEPYRVARRLKTIVSEVLHGDTENLPGTPKAVTSAYLIYEDQKVQLQMYPADTLQQARVVYRRPDLVRQMRMLESEGWSASPNFHFGFMAKGLCYTKTTIPITEYLSYWQANISDTMQVNRADWEEYWGRLEKAEIVEAADHKAFDRDFIQTERNSATPRPGLQCSFGWCLDEAERLDAKGQFVDAVKYRVNQLLMALGESVISPG